MSMKQSQLRLIIIAICVVVLLSGPGSAILGLSSIGYTSGYEGVRASFSGIEWEYGGKEGTYDPTPDTKFYFDADTYDSGAPNLVGEMTNAFVPEGSRPATWVPSEWWDTATGYINNPIETYTWNLENPGNPDETIAYEMQEWILKMYVSVTAEWDGNEYSNRRYQNTKIWIELDISPIWYFEGASQAYFAVGKVVCSDFAYGRLGKESAEQYDWLGNKEEVEYTPTPWISVAPESKTSYVYLYYQNYGKAGQVNKDYKTYKGKQLNPSLFTDQVYISLALNNFGTFYESPVDLSRIYKGDAVTWGFDVHVFVVGEWTVQDVEELPEDYGRTPKQYIDESLVSQIMNDPSFPLWSFIAIIAVILLVLAIFAPWVLFSIFGAIGMLRKK